KGFLYITQQEDLPAQKVSINISPKTLNAQSNEKVNISVTVKDKLNNPLPLKEVKIYRDGQLITSGKTNESGEIYFLDQPKEKLDMYITYKAICEDIESSNLLNLYRTDIDKRAFIELKAGKSAIFGGGTDSLVVYATLRDHGWAVLKDETITFEWKDTKGEK